MESSKRKKRIRFREVKKLFNSVTLKVILICIEACNNPESYWTYLTNLGLLVLLHWQCVRKSSSSLLRRPRTPVGREKHLRGFLPANTMETLQRLAFPRTISVADHTNDE